MIFKGEYGKSFLAGGLSAFKGPVRLEKVDETPREALWDRLAREYHYLGSENMIGSRVKYLGTLGERLAGAISFCKAAYKFGPRDIYVGWDGETRLHCLPGLLNNNRCLIPPWVRIRNLASHTLALALRRVRADWKSQYDVRPYMVVIFADADRYRGDCHIAANWTYLKTTKGLGRKGNAFVFRGHRKDLYVMVMSRRFARLFRPDTDRLSNLREEPQKITNAVPFSRENILEEMGIKDLAPAKFEKMLSKHLERYVPYLGRSEQRQYMVKMIKGLLSDLGRKSVEPIALALAGKGESGTWPTS
ncbi:MAG: DUF4338 domain-containing protein [Deltaproteobacteria bacterium]|jgi:hypothetical protein|nr:DUF4338 domain-containing protein [Deltaproteobacteria bacterium]